MSQLEIFKLLEVIMCILILDGGGLLLIKGAKRQRDRDNA